MKIFIFILFFFISIVCRSNYSFFFCLPPPCHDIGSGYQICSFDFESKEFWIAYNRAIVDEAEVGTFRVCEGGYAKDIKHIYYRGNKVVGSVDPKTFEYIKYGYAKGKDYFLHEDKLVPDVDIETVLILDTKYFKDKKSVYYQGAKLEGANPKTFFVFEETGYAKDKRNVFKRGNKIKKADPKTFVALNSFVAKDKNNTYYSTRIIDYIDSKTVEIFEDNSSFIKDKDRVYYSLEPIEGVDIDSFKYLGYGYMKDKNNAYYNGKIIEGADAETFEYYLKWDSNARDKNGYYRDGIKVKVY